MSSTETSCQDEPIILSGIGIVSWVLHFAREDPGIVRTSVWRVLKFIGFEESFILLNVREIAYCLCRCWAERQNQIERLHRTSSKRTQRGKRCQSQILR